MNELRKDAVNMLVVGEEVAGQRLDNFLARVLKGVPKSHIYRILRSGEVRVNSKRAGPDTRLAAGRHRLRVPPIRIAERTVSTTARPLEAELLYETKPLLRSTSRQASLFTAGVGSRLTA